MMDVAAVTESLWDLVLEHHLRIEVSTALGLNEELTGRWIAFWAGLHDLGKASPAFQSKWDAAGPWLLKNAGLPCRKPANPFPHGILTAKFVAELLPEVVPAFPTDIAGRLGRSLGGHHGSFPRSIELQQIDKAQRGGDKWQSIRRRLCQAFLTQTHLMESSIIPQKEPAHNFFILLAGLVSVADWIGSNADYFQMADPKLDFVQYAAVARRQAKEALQSLGWLGWHPPASGVPMGDLFPAVKAHGMRPLQASTCCLAKDLSGGGLVIIEAPMGEGKTEAAMYLADHWAVTLAQRGCYFALPTMATSNQMFSRVQDFLKDRYRDDSLVNLQLLHGHASLSAQFKALREMADKLFTPSDIEAEGQREFSILPAEVIAAEWFTYRKRGLLAPFGVGTVDQALMAVLKTRHYFVRLFGMAGKTIIIDEVHAYDAYMMKLLERLLEWLAALGCSVILLSATLPGSKRQALVHAFARGIGGESRAQEPVSEPYPRLTWVSRTSSGERSFMASPQFSRTINCTWTVSNSAGFSLGDKLQAALADGGCAAVICNTVGRAQEIFRSLSDYFPGGDVGDGYPELEVFHARCLFRDREELEDRVLRRFGKDTSHRPHRAVLVATQVIEQSLDIDFDLMVTEMAPVDLLLQRAGRLHRHDRVRPEPLNNPDIWIMSPEMEEDVPQFGKGTERVYDRHILLRSWLALKDRSSLAIPKEIEDLIKEVYDDDSMPGNLSQALAREWEESWETLQTNLEHEAAQAQFRYILSPNYVDDILEDSNPELIEDDTEVHKSLRAATRLADPTITLVCLFGQGDRVLLHPEEAIPLNLNEKPGQETTEALLRRSVTLSHRGLVAWLIRNGYRPEGWQKHPLLCRCRLLILDASNSWRGGNYELRVVPQEGVVISWLGKGG